MDGVIKTIQGFVAKDELINAIEVIIDHCSSNGRDQNLSQAILISRELYAIIHASRTGTIDWKEENIAKNQVAQRMLNLLF